MNTRLLLNPILDRLSPHEPEATPKTVLRVDGYLDEANSTTGFYAIAYSVSNLGNATAENVTLEVVVDGETQANMVIPSLSTSDSSNSLEVPASGSLHAMSLQASCTDSAAAYSFSFGRDVLRTFSDNPELVKLFVTPREPSLVALKDEVLKDAPLKVKDWIALRNWVGDNIQYRYDEEVSGVPEYWQVGKETVSLRTGTAKTSPFSCARFSALPGTPKTTFTLL